MLRQIQQEAEFFALSDLHAAVRQKLSERLVRVDIHVEHFQRLPQGCMQCM